MMALYGASSSSWKATGSKRSIGASSTSRPRARRLAAVVSSSGCGRVTRTAMRQTFSRRGVLVNGRLHQATSQCYRRRETPQLWPLTQGLKLHNDTRTLVLGIETTCDETAAAVVERSSDGSGRILSDIVRSQTEEHARFGGVVPEIAARAHVEVLDGIVERAMKEAGIGFAQLSAVAAAAGPGLIGGVIGGLTTGKAIAMVHDTPLIAVNHLEAHALTPRLTCALAFPYCLFLASGGHTQIVAVVGVGKYVRLGTTVDDAMGEAFDKVAKMLSLPYPGGPEVERAAHGGDAKRFAFPRPMLGRADANFSLSGLKTAVRNEASRLTPVEPQDISDLCASFQAAVLES